MIDIWKAKELATELHLNVNQYYDNCTYTVHLVSVVSTLAKYLHLIPLQWREHAICVAWLHDTIEDTQTTYSDLKHKLQRNIAQGNDAIFIADCVYDLTKPKGKTRAERMPDEYLNRIFSDVTMVTPVVKLCDIIANMSYSKITESDMYEKYKTEYVERIKPYLVSTPSLEPLKQHIEDIIRIDGRIN